MKLKNLFTRSKVEVFKLPKPKSITQEILLGLIDKNQISLFDFPFLPVSKRINDLRDTLEIDTNYKYAKTKYGNHYKYAIYSISVEEKSKAIELYLKLNSYTK